MKENILESMNVNDNITINYEKKKKIVIYVKNTPIIMLPGSTKPKVLISLSLYNKLLKNLIKWSENDYNTKFLDYKIAFPLLKELRRVGETRFQIIFQQEILKEYATRGLRVKEFLKNEGYLKLIGDFF